MLRDIFKKTATCACSSAGGFAIGHAGCVIAPLAIAATSAAGPAIGLAFSTAVTAGALYLWHRLRGKSAGTWEKRFVIGGALSGLLLSAAFHLSAKHRDDRSPENPPMCGGQYSIPKLK